jgi:PilZ domain-containing protein
MSPARSSRKAALVRSSPRIHSISNISVHYEGLTEELASRPPDLSREGMFINTTRHFPEGAILNLKFSLALTGEDISTRCEVRHCLPGVGVGVEFIGISPEAARAIEREIKLCKRCAPRPRLVKKK